MYQDNIPGATCNLPPCDCVPDRNYPGNPDWMYFFSEWEKIKDQIGDYPQLVEQINEIKTELHRLDVISHETLYKKAQNRKSSYQTAPVGVDENGKLWTRPPVRGVETVNGLSGDVVLTAESVGALPKDTVIPPEYVLPVASDTRLGGVRPESKKPEHTQPVTVDNDGKLFTYPSAGGYILPTATAAELGGVKVSPVTETQTQPVGIDASGKLFVDPQGVGEKEVDVYDFPPASIPKGIQLFVDESEDPPSLNIPTKTSELENDSEFEESQTIKVDNKLSGVTSIETLRTFLYTQRKATSRKAQFEISPGGINEYLIKILGYPDGVNPDTAGFLYIELPYSEAGGFEIRYRWQNRTKPGIWNRVDYGTLNSNWQSSGWIPLSERWL